jgi:hypothetical protein
MSNASSCAVEASLPRFVDDDLAPENSARIAEHLQSCQICREHERTLRQLISDLRAPVLSDFDARAHARDVLAAISSSRSERPALPLRAARWLALAATAIAALLPLGYMAVRAPSSSSELQARGGGDKTPSIARDVGVELYAGNLGHEPLAPLRPGATLNAEQALTAGYRNLGAQPVSMLLFALDARGTIHWISPRFSDPQTDPVATVLPPSPELRLLPTTVVFDEPAPGVMRVFTVLRSTPMHVSDVEALDTRANNLSARDITRRIPDAQARETTLRVEESE